MYIFIYSHLWYVVNSAYFLFCWVRYNAEKQFSRMKGVLPISIHTYQHKRITNAYYNDYNGDIFDYIGKDKYLFIELKSHYLIPIYVINNNPDE